MNDMELFLNFGAVIKINKYYGTAPNRSDLNKFIKVMRKIRFLNEYVDYFEKSFWNKDFNEFDEKKFWHIVEINGGKSNDTAIEFQWGKGFTFGSVKDYLNYDDTIKVLSVDNLITLI